MRKVPKGIQERKVTKETLGNEASRGILDPRGMKDPRGKEGCKVFCHLIFGDMF